MQRVPRAQAVVREHARGMLGQTLPHRTHKTLPPWVHNHRNPAALGAQNSQTLPPWVHNHRNPAALGAQPPKPCRLGCTELTNPAPAPPPTFALKIDHILVGL